MSGHFALRSANELLRNFSILAFAPRGYIARAKLFI